MKVTIEVELDDKHWFALAGLADEMGLKIPAMIEGELHRVLRRLAHWHPRKPNATVAVRGKYRKPGDGQNPYRNDKPFAEDDARRAVVRDRWEAGWSVSEICRYMGVDRRKVGATVWALGYDTGKRMVPPVPPAARRGSGYFSAAAS